MKKLLYFLCMCGIFACQEDFDELKDTQQRHVLFTFHVEELFSKVLVANGDTYQLGEVCELPADYRMRITVYGYDHFDSLIYEKTVLSDYSKSLVLKVRHLQADQTYHFAFVADVVKYDHYVDYFETWFLLGTKYWPDAYIYADERNENALCNSMAFSEMLITPNNQQVKVVFKPITYNGFCVFNGLNSIDRLSGYVMYCSKFLLKNRTWQRRNSLSYKFDEHNLQESGSFIMPVSLCDADSVVTVKMRTLTLSGADSTIIDIPNKGRRPFVATFNCTTLELDNCNYY